MASFTDLPPEVIDRILHLAVNGKYGDRDTINYLKNLAPIHSSITGPARRLLFRHLRLSANACSLARTFAACLEKDESLFSAPQAIEMDSSVESQDLFTVLNGATCVRHVRIVGGWNTPKGAEAIDALSRIDKVQTLEIENVRPRNDTRRWRPEDIEKMMHFMDASFIDVLRIWGRTLELIHFHETNIRAFSIPEARSLIFPRLTQLILESVDFGNDRSLLLSLLSSSPHLKVLRLDLTPAFFQGEPGMEFCDSFYSDVSSCFSKPELHLWALEDLRIRGDWSLGCISSILRRCAPLSEEDASEYYSQFFYPPLETAHGRERRRRSVKIDLIFKAYTLDEYVLCGVGAELHFLANQTDYEDVRQTTKTTHPSMAGPRSSQGIWPGLVQFDLLSIDLDEERTEWFFSTLGLPVEGITEKGLKRTGAT